MWVAPLRPAAVIGWLKLTVPVHDPSADDSTHTPLTQKDGMVDEIRAALPFPERNVGCEW